MTIPLLLVLRHVTKYNLAVNHLDQLAILFSAIISSWLMSSPKACNDLFHLLCLFNLSWRRGQRRILDGYVLRLLLLSKHLLALIPEGSICWLAKPPLQTFICLDNVDFEAIAIIGDKKLRRRSEEHTSELQS